MKLLFLIGTLFLTTAWFSPKNSPSSPLTFPPAIPVVTDEKSKGSILPAGRGFISYPVFEGIETKETVNQVVLNFVDQLEGTYSSYNTHLKANYVIMHYGTRLASVLFTGQVDGVRGIQPFRSTLNINMENGSRLQLNDLVLLDGDFIDIVYKQLKSKLQSRKGDITTLFPTGIEDIINQADYHMDSPIHSYFTPYEIGLIFKVPEEFGSYITVIVPNKFQEVFE